MLVTLLVCEQYPCREPAYFLVLYHWFCSFKSLRKRGRTNFKYVHNYCALKHVLKYIPGAGPSDLSSPHESQSNTSHLCLILQDVTFNISLLEKLNFNLVLLIPTITGAIFMPQHKVQFITLML